MENEIEAQINAMVKAEVSENLKHHIPDDLQAELKKNKQELEDIQRDLHNSYVACFVYYHCNAYPKPRCSIVKVVV